MWFYNLHTYIKFQGFIYFFSLSKISLPLLISPWPRPDTNNQLSSANNQRNYFSLTCYSQADTIKSRTAAATRENWVTGMR